ncbi:glycosyltransferase family 2 protein [Halorussus salinisoli]|uniref:glycosyltransferase family 2 protein n=1 Tax=Halorussus salinisoli TaxID=2558242 RepID=UPI002A90F3BE|nr:glycosyltransferase family A protein [Halorussus salinisoli]
MLAEAKSSVDAQSVPTEIVVVEDTDQRGPAWARNRGLERATRRYVAFLDADDHWRDGKLEMQLDRLRESSAGICVEGEYSSSATFMRDLFVMKASSLTSSVLLDTKQVDVRFEESLERREDHLFILEAASQAGACFASDLVQIRKHEGGLSSRNTPELRIEQNEEFVNYVRSRVDEQMVEQFRDELFRRLHHRIGRSAYHDGKYGKSTRHLWQSLTYGFSVKTAGALLLSSFHYLWERMSR